MVIIMKKSFVIMGIILLLVGIMIIVSISTSGATEEKSKSYVTESNGVSVWIINPVEEKYKAPNVETWGYVTGVGAMLLGGWLLLNSKQKDLLKTDKT